jgi:hypothetical protein
LFVMAMGIIPLSRAGLPVITFPPRKRRPA